MWEDCLHALPCLALLDILVVGRSYRQGLDVIPGSPIQKFPSHWLWPLVVLSAGMVRVYR